MPVEARKCYKLDPERLYCAYGGGGTAHVYISDLWGNLDDARWGAEQLLRMFSPLGSLDGQLIEYLIGALNYDVMADVDEETAELLFRKSRPLLQQFRYPLNITYEQRVRDVSIVSDTLKVTAHISFDVRAVVTSPAVRRTTTVDGLMYHRTTPGSVRKLAWVPLKVLSGTYNSQVGDYIQEEVIHITTVDLRFRT